MRGSLAIALAVAGLTALAGPAAAQGEWKRVHLDNETTVEIPAVVGEDYRVPPELAAQGDLMFFSVSTDKAGLLDCLLKHTFYGPGRPGRPSRAEMIDTVGEDKRLSLCIGRGTNRRKAIDEGGMLKGYPSARCVVGYTDQAQADAEGADLGTGRVLDTLTVVAGDAYYTLACTVRASDQRTAEREWFEDWRQVIQHIQGSLLAP